jgi:hypothetical protein
MGRESASYFLALAPELEEAVVLALREGGAEPGDSDRTWIDLRVRDAHRYWIDLRVHRGPEPLLEIRIALCNDEWSIRAPLEDALTALLEPRQRRRARLAPRARGQPDRADVGARGARAPRRASGQAGGPRLIARDAPSNRPHGKIVR